MSATENIGWRLLLIKRLRTAGPLPDEALARLSALDGAQKEFDPDAEIANEPGAAAIVASGSVYRYRLLADGRRVVFDLALPGDLIALAPPVPESGVAFAASSKLQLVLVRQRQIQSVSEDSPELAAALEKNAQAQGLRMMAHVLRLSRLTAYERVLHFLLETHDRLDAVDLAEDGRFQMPFNQIVLSDALGMTKFHVNRTLKRLRNEGRVEINHQTIQLHDTAALAELCEYECWAPANTSPPAETELAVARSASH